MHFAVLRSCASFVSYRRPCHRILASQDISHPPPSLTLSHAYATSTSLPHLHILFDRALPITDDFHETEQDRTNRLRPYTTPAQAYNTIRFTVIRRKTF